MSSDCKQFSKHPQMIQKRCPSSYGVLAIFNIQLNESLTVPPKILRIVEKDQSSKWQKMVVNT